MNFIRKSNVNGNIRNFAFAKFRRHLHTTLPQFDSLTATHYQNGAKTIQLNNPKKRNVLSLAMLDQLKNNLLEDMSNVDVRCIVIKSSGPVFSAGHDLQELLRNNDQYRQRVFHLCTEVMTTIQTIPVPVVAQVKGLATAAGCQLAATCDIVIASESASFSTPGSSVGLFCSTPGIALARAVPRKVSSYMLLTGRAINADEALKCGLVSKVVADGKLEEETSIVIESILAKSRAVTALGKKFYNEQVENDINTAYKKGEQIMVENLSFKDTQEGITAFFEKRKPRWTHSTDKELS